MTTEKTLTNRQLQAMRTREKIIQTGSKLIESKGYNKVTIDDITNACGLGKGTFYYHFKSKDELLSVISSQYHDRILERLHASRGQAVASRLRLFISSWFDAASDLGFSLSTQLLKYIIDEGGETVEFLKDNIRTILNDAIEDGEFRPDTPVDTILRVYMRVLYGSSVVWSIDKGTSSLAQWAEEFSVFAENTILSRYYSQHKS